MKAAAVLAATLLLASVARAAPLDAFTAAFGEDGVRALTERGVLVVQGRGPARRLGAAHWKALEALAAAAPSCRAFAAAAADMPPAAPDLGLAPCRALTDGAMTPRLQALAAAVAAEGEERWALVASGASLAEPPGVPNLFDTAWGRELAARRRADRLEDPAPLAKGFFEDSLAAPRPNADAVKHFVSVLTARGVPGVQAKLDADAARGAASDELRALIRRYLQDERRRHGLALARERRKALLGDKDTRRDLDALQALAGALGKPGLLASLETAVAGAPSPTGAPHLRSAGLHLREPVRLGQYELGDEAVVSGAYWVDGLPEGASAEIEETTWLETGRGFTGLETNVVKRRNGGPYPFERGLTIAETRPFAVAARVSAASGTVIMERAEVPVAPDFELSLKREAEVLQDLQACDPKSAETAAAALEDLLGDAAKAKPQYKTLLERVKKEKARAAADQEALARLDEAVGASRVDSSPEQCRFDAARTDAAIKLARALPPGCDRVLPELFAQRALISRRAVDQAWFLKASADARSRRRSCDFEGAARRWSEALSVLEADPAARCGKADAEAKAAETELSSARRAALWSAKLAKGLDQAEAETLPAGRLALTTPLIARLNALEDGDCRRDLLKRAVRLSEKAGEDENGPAAADAARRLPAESNLAAVVADVRRVRARQLDTSDAASAPTATAPAPAAAPPPPPAKKIPAIRKKTAPKAKPQPAPADDSSDDAPDDAAGSR